MEIKKIAAFSLLELLVVLAVTGISSLIAYVSLHDFSRTRLIREVDSFATQLESLALLAMQRDEDLSLSIKNDGYIVEAEEERLLNVKFAKGVTVETKKVIKLYRSGTVSPASFFIKKAGESCLVVISLRGRVRSDCES